MITLDTYLGHTRQNWLQEFSRRMNELSVKVGIQHPDYKKCERIYAYLANQIRMQQKSDLATLNQ